ncbi:MAG: oligosaccharide flippase family protein [Chloroflexi bacterium]|nr:oligosaccharide flippase family protein [Chloroflexota bacterium]MBI3170753.1 oligosaccharide flippase family protein [Chloroflexota bacterium]
MLKNITWTVLSRYGVQGISLVSNILLVRYLGADGYGEYALSSSVMLIGNAFTSFGMDMILIRRLAAGQEDAVLADGLWIQVTLSGVYIAGVFLVGIFVPLPLSMKVYSFALLPLAFYSVFTIVIRARQQMQIFSIAQLMISALHLFSVFLTWFLNGGVLAFFLFLIASHAIVAAWGLGHRESRISHWRFSIKQIIVLFNDCSYMAVLGTLRLLHEKVVFILLPSLAGIQNAGIFSAASRVVDAGKLGHQSALTAIYPEMARDEEFGKQMKGIRPLLGAAVLIAIFLSILAEPIVTLLFGKEFGASVFPLQVMAWTVVPYVLATYITVGLVALGYERTLLALRLPIFILLVFLLFTLTSKFGIAGSAFAILAVELIQVAFLWQIWRTHVLSKLP